MCTGLTDWTSLIGNYAKTQNFWTYSKFMILSSQMGELDLCIDLEYWRASAPCPMGVCVWICISAVSFSWFGKCVLTPWSSLLEMSLNRSKFFIPVLWKTGCFFYLKNLVMTDAATHCTSQHHSCLAGRVWRWLISVSFHRKVLKVSFNSEFSLASNSWNFGERDSQICFHIHIFRIAP